MPNQLSQSKKRTTLAEHEAVLAILVDLAREDRVAVADLLREAARELITRRAKDPNLARRFLRIAQAHAPTPPKGLKTPAQAARFKRQQREFDELVRQLHLVDPDELQKRNSLAPDRSAVRLVAIR